MIFRWWHKRRIASLFGAYLSQEQINAVMRDSSEWDCFRLLLPRPINRLLFRPAMTDGEAYAEIIRAIRRILADVEAQAASEGSTAGPEPSPGSNQQITGL